jgi:hypothetical protein
MKLKLMTTAILGLALALPSISNAAPAPSASAAAATPTQPTLSLKKDCETFPGLNSVNVTLAGLPPFTEFVGTLVTPGGGTLSSSETTDASGSFDVTVGSAEPGIFEATVVWSGGTLTQSLFVDCSTPASKEECKRDGWRNFPQFKNQGQCIAFVNHGKAGTP